MSRMQELENIFNQAKEKEHYVAVVIKMDGFPTNEVIINHPENIETKLAYYKKTYTDNCEHKYAADIKIIDALSGSSFQSIQKQLENPFELGDE